MNDELLLRYSRQILLPQIDIWGQEKIIQARVLIIGAGGLGCPAAMYLAAAGVGHLTLADDDRVEPSNLQRQIAHHTEDIGRHKAESAKRTLLSLNPNVQVESLCERLQGQSLLDQVKKADIVLDCSDNFPTRFEVNRASIETQTPLVSGAAIRFEGQVAVFDSRQQDSPCYNCLYPNLEELAESCSETGVIAPITGIVGSIQALEAIKVLLNIGQPLIGKLLLLDGLSMEWHCMTLPKNPACPTCGAN
ncbi:MAG: molybdopterin-synthase adenylyltransferase [Methylothermaceae bacteria B42]|nr:MAG: molybdopterin-synthase adenylyltransferase [Methylothermaceae bacteria B42]HHJ38576.1 molybdopterin-synthase adenylyltransferase MoeB [Methylothermaceae bacterium]